MFGALHSVSTGLFADETVKNALVDYATEHFEIASYHALSEGARGASQAHVAQICSEILRDEQEMADWLASQLLQIVREASTNAALLEFDVP